MEEQARDRIAVEDEHGHTKEFSVEALFDMEEQKYALLASDDEDDELVLMRVIGGGDEQYLVGIDDPEEAAAILGAYQVAVEAAPAQ